MPSPTTTLNKLNQGRSNKNPNRLSVRKSKLKQGRSNKNPNRLSVRKSATKTLAARKSRKSSKGKKALVKPVGLDQIKLDQIKRKKRNRLTTDIARTFNINIPTAKRVMFVVYDATMADKEHIDGDLKAKILSNKTAEWLINNNAKFDINEEIFHD